MNGLAASMAELKALKDRLAQNPRARGRCHGVPSSNAAGPGALLPDRKHHPARRARLPSSRRRRPYWRHLGRDACRCRRLRRHRRPFRAARRPWRARCARQGEGRAGHRAGLAAIVCIGETGEERRAGTTLEVEPPAAARCPRARAANTVIAYEPVWAIGTGLTPTPADVAELHGFFRAALGSWLGQREASDLRLLYGGSVKPDNASELLSSET